MRISADLDLYHTIRLIGMNMIHSSIGVVVRFARCRIDMASIQTHPLPPGDRILPFSREVRASRVAHRDQASLLRECSDFSPRLPHQFLTRDRGTAWST